MKKYGIVGLVCLMAPLVFGFAIGQDIFVPELPQFMGIFHVSQKIVQLTVSVFMISAGLGQLIVGPLSDQFGRKKLVLLSTGIYCVGSLIAAWSPNIDVMIFARIMQGAGACGMMVCAFAIVRDLLSGNDSAKAYSYLNSAIAISPLLAPFLGGYLDVWFGWRAPFIALGVIGFMVFLLMLIKLEETQDPTSKIKVDRQLFKRYLTILKNRNFLGYSFVSCSALACFFTFFSISSYILIGTLKIPEVDFGYYFAIVGILFFFGSLAAGKCSSILGVKRMVYVGGFGFVISGAWMLLWTFYSGTNIWNFMLPSGLCALTGAFILGAGASGALEPFPEMTGTASAMYGSLEFIFAALIASVVMIWPVGTNYSFAIPLLVFGFLSIFAVWKVVR